MHLGAQAGPLAMAGILVLGGSAGWWVWWEASPMRALMASANALGFRVGEGRFAEPFEHRPLRAALGPAESFAEVQASARALRRRWGATASPEVGRLAGTALAITGQSARALSLLGEVLHRETNEWRVDNAIGKSVDASLLTDYSAAALQESADRKNLLRAYEAADRAWRLARLPGAAWNRAAAADRLGMPASAARAWKEAVALDPASAWANEAEARGLAASRRAEAPPEPSIELFFLRGIVEGALRGEPTEDCVPGDRLASDTVSSLGRLSPSDRARAEEAMRSYVRGRTAFEKNDFEAAHVEFASAEAELDSLHVTLALLARDQRIRSECSRGTPGCLETMRAFRTEIATKGRYRWLAARAAYGEGQALYRQGRVYEAVEQLTQAKAAFEELHDDSAAAFMRVLLANAYGAAGETELALAYHLDALPYRAAHIGDRRRKQLEDTMLFLLRHGYIATTELLLEELASSPTTNAARVMEEMLRGVLAFRREQPAAASYHFQRAHDQLGMIEDETARADVQLRLAIAESGSRTLTTRPMVEELDAAIAAHEHSEFSVWLPQLLTERGVALETSHQLSRAESDYRRAMGILEQREPRIDASVLALGVVSQGESPFDHAIELLLRGGRIAAALAVEQRSTALRISSLHARGAGVADAFRGSREHGDGTAALRAGLRPREIAIAQHLLPSELVTWIVTVDSIRAIRRPVAATELPQLLDRLRACAARPGCQDEGVVDSISDVLVRDWIDRVPRGATLLIQPPAELEAVPFSILKTGAGERLVSRNSVVTAPSFGAFARASLIDAERAGPVTAYFAAAPSPGRNLAALPRSVSEADRASRAYPGALVDSHAPRARFLDSAPSFAVVHFAGHVLVNAQRPLFSAMVFQGGEMLYVHELRGDSFAHARLVVLSGCESGRSPRPTMSVANALLSQNVPSVVYTVWPVSDEAAEEFAVAFHRAIASGRSRADAVRDAQLSMARLHPGEFHRWAAFALAGAPGPLTSTQKIREDLWHSIP